MSGEENEDLFTDDDIKLIEETLKYKIKWLTRYINKHDKFGGAETAKVKRQKLHNLVYKIRMNA